MKGHLDASLAAAVFEHNLEGPQQPAVRSSPGNGVGFADRTEIVILNGRVDVTGLGQPVFLYDKERLPIEP